MPDLVRGAGLTAAQWAAMSESFNTLFNKGFENAKLQTELLAMKTVSNGEAENYTWLQNIPAMRKWVGGRVVKSVGVGGYRLENDDTELTIEVPRNKAEDNQLGTFGPLFQEMGRMAKVYPDLVLAVVMAAGWSSAIGDGKYFFATDHPITETSGSTGTQANTDGGSGTPWFLMDLSRAIKPFIYQVRKEPEFVALNRPTDNNVFYDKAYRYGVDGRMNCGYGSYQFCWGSKQTLNSTNFATAFSALEQMKMENGVPMGCLPTHLVVPPSLRSSAQAILNRGNPEQGGDNDWYKTVELIVWPYLGLSVES